MRTGPDLAGPPASDASLRAFVAESPINRTHIARFVAGAAASLRAGSRVLDAGAGSAPYRSLFAHTDYVTSDWAQSMHPEARRSDVIAPLHSLPLADASFDAVVSTEVLEHVLEPAAVLAELARVLVPGGRLWLTTPFVWELHEEPHDYFRYTAHALRELVAGAGFTQVDVEPFGGYFSALGQLVRSFGSITGRGRPGRGPAGRAASSLLWRLGPLLARLDRLDDRRGLPLGYGLSAVKPRP